MTTPLIPAGHGRASPQRHFDPSNLHDWINVLHNAAKVPQGHADYADAQDAMQQALEQIGHLNRVAGTADREAMAPEPTGLVASTVAPFAHGASFGIGEPIAGAFDAVTGGSFREGAQRYREGLDRLEASHPTASAAAEIAGMVAPAAAPARASVGAIEAGIPLRLPQILARVGKGAATGAAIGGVSGFSQGGEDPGDLSQRVEAAKSGAASGAVIGGILTGGALAVGRAHAERMADLEARGARRRAVMMREELLRRRLDAADRPPTVELPVAEPPPGGMGPTAFVATKRAAQAERGVTPEIRGGFPRAGSEPAPLSPSALVDQLPDVMQTSRGGAGRVAPPMSVSPAAAEASLPVEMQTSRGLAPDIRPRPEMTQVVPAGPYQRAAPATRMQSGPMNLVTEAIRQSGRHPELLEPIPTETLQLHYQLGQVMGGSDDAAMQAVARELAKRLRQQVGASLNSQP